MDWTENTAPNETFVRYTYSVGGLFFRMTHYRDTGMWDGRCTRLEDSMSLYVYDAPSREETEKFLLRFKEMLDESVD
jgi:hypothetical protein